MVLKKQSKSAKKTFFQCCGPNVLGPRGRSLYDLFVGLLIDFLKNISGRQGHRRRRSGDDSFRHIS